jgi:putative transposase
VDFRPNRHKGDPPRRKSRFTKPQIVSILREFDAGTPADKLARRHGIHANTIRLCRSKYAGMSASDPARLKQLEAENAESSASLLPKLSRSTRWKSRCEKHSWSLPGAPKP